MADETKWTPGPWEVNERVNDQRDDGRIGISSRESEIFVATTCGDVCDLDDDSIEQEQANAHLIASAPNLYAALSEAIVELQEFCELTRFWSGNARTRRCIDVCEAAQAAAIGGQP